jgi:hypothetical protein
MFLGTKVQRMHRADNLNTICELILNILQPYRPPRPVMGIAFLLVGFNTVAFFFCLRKY